MFLPPSLLSSPIAQCLIQLKHKPKVRAVLSVVETYTMLKSGNTGCEIKSV